MSFAPTKAREAFNAAEKELEGAISKYNEARASLQRETGEFTATDKSIMLKFSAATGATSDRDHLTDC